MAAHEVGHLMGRPDQYNEEGPKVGYETNIMGTIFGRPNRSDIDAVLSPTNPNRGKSNRASSTGPNPPSEKKPDNSPGGPTGHGLYSPSEQKTSPVLDSGK